jgi:two-component system cell cycle response regulator
MGVIAGAAARLGGVGGRILIVDDNERQSQRVAAELAVEHRPVVESDYDKALQTARGPVDIIIVNAAARAFDGLRFCAALRSDEASRNMPVLVIVDPDDRPRLVKALEIGVNDILTRPIDPQELSARARTQIKRKRYTDFLRQNLDHSLELAVTDQLTGLHNRRYMETQLAALVKRASMGGEPVAALMIDIDHFKKINDTYGHVAGDSVLRQLAGLVRPRIREHDIFGRVGGEEFGILLPEVDLLGAKVVAEKVRIAVEAASFLIKDETFGATVSLGCASLDGTTQDSAERLYERADKALYAAKRAGRNRVVVAE